VVLVVVGTVVAESSQRKCNYCSVEVVVVDRT
jgi:hypothetical protein